MREVSIDAGERRALSNVLGSAVYAWDALGRHVRTEHDALERPTHLWVRPEAGAEGLAVFALYGESYPTPEASNLRGKLCILFDGGGVVRTESFDFKGNALTWSRRLAVAYTTEPDWAPLSNQRTPSATLAAAAPLLETETFSKTFVYDALNRVMSATMPDASEIRPAYNETSRLENVDVRIRGASAWTSFVSELAYDPKGRRTRIDYGNGTFTESMYDELTFRLARLKTTRSSDGKLLQDLRYTFDPVGNIVEVQDHAHEDVSFANAQVSPRQRFAYDPLYRLIWSSGRGHAGGVGDAQRDNRDVPLWNLPHPNDAQALRVYEESYVYDGVGNLLEFFHDAGAGPQTWRRYYKYGAGTGDGSSNRLCSTSLPGDTPGGSYSATYAHDANGNMTAMPHLASLAYTHRDQMRHVNLSGGGDAYSTYDAGGQRVRKVWAHSGLTEERVYLGGYEVYRKRASSGLVLERETLHVMDNTRRIAMVETKTVDTSVPAFTPVPRTRFQVGNHLDSTILECDEGGLVISYEEYHPYGTTAYRSARSGVEVSERRYRYTGKERDEETGLYYHGARYYAPWLGRWTSADPAGMVDGANLYAYVRGNPLRLGDPSGTQGDEPSYGLEALQRINDVNAAQLGVASATPEEQKAQREQAAEAANASVEAAREAAQKARATPATKQERCDPPPVR